MTSPLKKLHIPWFILFIVLLGLFHLLWQCSDNLHAKLLEHLQEHFERIISPDEKEICNNVTVTKSILCIDGAPVDLSSIKNREEFFSRLLDEIHEPTAKQKTFVPATASTKLTIVLIVTNPGPEPRIRGAIKNIAHIYGGKDVAFIIISNANHQKVLHEYLGADWKNVEVIYIGGEFSVSNYNQMLTSKWFWGFFDSEFVLITHTDSMIFRPLDDWMFNYDLIGAPWLNMFNGAHPNVGNGGYTLRNVNEMKRVLEKTTYDASMNEDIWWSDHVSKLQTEDQASIFSIETLGSKDSVIPTGAHKLYSNAPFYNSADAFRLIQRMARDPNIAVEINKP